MSEISIVIPAFNEAEHIAPTVKALEKVPGLKELIIVDDGSTDNTALIAQKAGAQVLALGSNKGKGYALNKGVSVVTGEIILLLDADLRDSAKEAALLVEPIINDQADLTIAKFKREKSGHGLGLAKKTAQLGIKVLTGAHINAPLSGQRALKREVLLELLPFAPRFGLEIGMTIDALKKRYRILEIETDMSHCPPGRDLAGIIHRGKQFYNICYTIGTRVLR